MTDMLIEKFQPLSPWFVRHKRDCWLPVVEDGDGGPTDSKFSGHPWLTDAEEWPACGNCQRPMALFLQLNLATVHDLLQTRIGDGLLQAFFCLDIDCINGPEEGDPFSSTHLLRVVDPDGQGGSPRQPPANHNPDDEIPTRRIIAWERADDYPSMTEARELGLDHEVNDLVVCSDPPVSIKAELQEFIAMPWSRGNEKLGGWPGWVNICTEYPDCPECGRRMDSIIFQFGHEGFIPIMFGDGGQGQIVCCSDHPQILGYPWSCG